MAGWILAHLYFNQNLRYFVNNLSDLAPFNGLVIEKTVLRIESYLLVKLIDFAILLYKKVVNYSSEQSCCWQKVGSCLSLLFSMSHIGK